MAKRPKSTGEAGATKSPVLHAPGGLPGALPPSRPRKMSLSVGLLALGATALVGGGIYESKRRADREQACREAALKSGGNPALCQQPRSSGSSSGGHSSTWSSRSSSSSSATPLHSSGSSSGTHATSGGHGSFGGFGATGAGHSASS